ncbi:NAD(P)/FAD-dependent oxidoreductase [Alkalibacter saccharofermentans]|uniref:Thioredoxin reductase (NADPH) n=1 Tax=Alkalibacter saccharofermentans DSM 14828 TaxID=1120975 RepID=A0A1M4VJ68_9FIRM|nr:NAD(P)/FAD-dependent oxidoreductase [Alkalibacter saccharofermentans]SHE69024.1 thioredoxin reductase (NADPH) [Alkalibacter saccharofermentans DSM 14828]
MSERYDIIIVGSGPAGVSAAINGVIRNKKVKVFGSKHLSDKLEKAPRVDNYLGYHAVSGPELKDVFVEHLNQMNIDITEEKVDAVYAMGEYFAVTTKDNTYEADSVIVASGVSNKKSLPGEEAYLGKGVGYCATCDAPIYKNKKVAIVAYHKHAEEEANYMLDVASEVYYVPVYGQPEKIREGVKVIAGKPKQILGSEHAEKLVLSDGEILADGIFILKDSVALDQLVPGVDILENHFNVNRNMETNIPGLYAAGDCTGKPYQYLKAAGEGQVAALNAVSYLDKR